LAADLVGRKVDLIVASGGAPSALAAKGATSTTPIVFSTGDPVAEGLVASLARPGGNLTGVSAMAVELMPKRFELLSELVPRAGVIALLVNPNNPDTEAMIRDVQEAAPAKGVQLAILKAGRRRRDVTAVIEFRDRPFRRGHGRSCRYTGLARGLVLGRFIQQAQRVVGLSCISCLQRGMLAPLSRMKKTST
jgi:hypothetical protein